MKHLIPTIALFLLLGFGASAHVSNDSTHSLHISDKIVQQLDEKIDLSPEQESKVYPLMFDKVRKVRELRHEYHGKKNAEKLKQELSTVRNQFTMDIRKVLTPDQFKQYKKFVKEVRCHNKKNKKQCEAEDSPQETHENNVL